MDQTMCQGTDFKSYNYTTTYPLSISFLVADIFVLLTTYRFLGGHVTLQAIFYFLFRHTHGYCARHSD
jgi:hypothetical protein